MISGTTNTNLFLATSNVSGAFGDGVKSKGENNSSYKNNLFSLENLNSLNSSQTKYIEDDNAKTYARENNSLSSSQSKTSKYISTWKIGEFKENLKKTIFTHVNDKITPIEEENIISSSSTGCDSDFSILSNNKQRDNNKEEFRANSSELTNPLRLFNKRGKPLTDQKGRTLFNIFSEQLVIFDDKGKPISDLKGNQVFNCHGESSIYPTTDLHLPPSEEEPGVPLLDVGRDNILFLYDNTGHPLTDSYGRPLLSASGNPLVGMTPNCKVPAKVSATKNFCLKKMYGKKPLENVIRHIQIFDFSGKPLTDECGVLIEGATIICNENGMPVCDACSRPVYFKYGSRMLLAKRENIMIKENAESGLELPKTSDDSISDQLCMSNNLTELKRCEGKENGGEKDLDESPMGNSLNHLQGNSNIIDYNDSIRSQSIDNNKNTSPPDEFETDRVQNIHLFNETIHDTIKNTENISIQPTVQSKEMIFTENKEDQTHSVRNKGISLRTNSGFNITKGSSETILLYNANEEMDNSSSVNVEHFESIKRKTACHERSSPRKMYSINLFQYIKDSFSKPSESQNVESYQYNEYGKPLTDIHGNPLYDKYGIPLTGAHGRKLSEKARQALRFKLRNVPKNRVHIASENVFLPLSRNESHDQFGEPIYDKYGRPLYDLAGILIYDRFGRPLTDAFGRPLVDAIGQPLMDCDGRVLTSAFDSDPNTKLVDIFGRRIYDKRGRLLFDSYGRPKYDVFTNAIYDSCGRPATDANGKQLLDFLNKPIQPFPEKPLHKNARSHLPKHIDTVLSIPSMYRLLKYSQPLEDVFGGPLFDDLGRPLYNKIGKPLYDRYGRPLYMSDGTPLCDSYGRPMSEDIRKDDDDQTISVVDCLKLLKVTEESSKWMVGSRNRLFKPSKSEVSKKEDKVSTVEISYKRKSGKRSGQYVYTLTRVTKFVSGRQELEILEAPLSPATIAEMHRLPVDNKPLVMVVGQRHKKTVKQ